MQKKSPTHFQQIPLKEIQHLLSRLDELQNDDLAAKKDGHSLSCFLSASPLCTLVPGSVVTASGIYVVAHSAGHRLSARCILLAGLILPNCPENGCSVSYCLVRPGTHISDDEDFMDSTAGDDHTFSRSGPDMTFCESPKARGLDRH